MQRSQFYLLKTRRFLPLFFAQLLPAFNDNAFKTALIMLITYKLISDPNHALLLINLAGGIFILPFLLFSATAGQLADKFNRVSMIRWIKISELVFMLGAIIGFYLENIELLLTLLFFMGTHSAFFGPIKYSILPNLLHKKELLGGNGLIEASTFVMVLIGTIVGTVFGTTTRGAILVATFGVVMAYAGWMSSLFIPNVPLADAKLTINPNPFTETAEVIRQTRANPCVHFVILVISWFWAVGFVFVTEFPIFSKTVIGGNEQVVTLLLVLFSIGVAAGALLSNVIFKGAINFKYVPHGIIGVTLFALDLCWASSSLPPPSVILFGVPHFLNAFAGWRICLDLFLFSMAAGFYIVPLYTIMQTQSDSEHRSRVIGCNNIFNAIFMIGAAILTIALHEISASIVQIFLIIAILNLLVAFLVWKKMPSFCSIFNADQTEPC